MRLRVPVRQTLSKRRTFFWLHVVKQCRRGVLEAGGLYPSIHILTLSVILVVYHPVVLKADVRFFLINEKLPDKSVRKFDELGKKADKFVRKLDMVFLLWDAGRRRRLLRCRRASVRGGKRAAGPSIHLLTPSFIL